MSKTKNKAIFLDRDGTIIKEKPGTYLARPEGVKLYKNTLRAFALFKKMGFKVFVVSNQSGIGRGYFSAREVDAVNARMARLLKPGAEITEIIYCPHAPATPCSCRKPAPAMGAKLIKKYNVDAAKSYMIGDKKSDVDFGLNLNLTPILVLTANGRAQTKKYGAKIRAAKITRDIYGAAKYIENENK